MEPGAGTAPLAAEAAGDGFLSLLRLSLNAHGLLLSAAFVHVLGFVLLHFLVPGMGSKPGGEILAGILFFSVKKDAPIVRFLTGLTEKAAVQAVSGLLFPEL